MRSKLVLLMAVGLFAWAANAEKTVLDGVYSADQAARGQAAYSARCSSCHLNDLTGYRGALHGIAFAEKFQGDTLDGFFDVTKASMPRGAPSSLSDQTYLDIIAYVLQVNSYPSGSEDLKSDALKSIRVVGKAGPEEVPNFALIKVIGCMAPGSGDIWTLTQATEFEKVRNPDASNATELKADEARPLGTRTIRLEDASYFKPASHKDHKMAAKGFLMRQAEGDKINITSLQMLSENCAK